MFQENVQKIANSRALTSSSIRLRPQTVKKFGIFK